VMQAMRLADGDRGPAGGGKTVPYTAGRWLWKASGGLRPSAPVAARWAWILCMSLLRRNGEMVIPGTDALAREMRSALDGG
jgi:hypothetical protein